MFWKAQEEMASPALVVALAGAVLVPMGVVVPLTGMGSAAAAVVECAPSLSGADTVAHSDDPASPTPDPAPPAVAAPDTDANNVVWPVGRGQMGGLHPTGARDMGRNLGYPVVAAHDGTVTASADIPAQDGRINGGGYGSYGRYIIISWRNSKGQWLNNLYAHMRTRVATAGSTVTAGQLIGYVGSTGNSTGPHLHFELFASSGPNGLSGSRSGLDPAPWLARGKEPQVDDLPADTGGDITTDECVQSGGVAVDLPTRSPANGPYKDAAITMRSKGVSRSPSQAVAWLLSAAKRHVGGYPHMCLALADDAYAPRGSRVGRAIDQWYRAKRAGYGHPGDYNIPIGAQVFFWTGNPARHIATYVGGGYAVNQDANGVVVLVPVAEAAKGGDYLGWAEPYYS